ncbi:MAG: alpha/beta fold hydrolase [Paracoccaceae bacterium]
MLNIISSGQPTGLPPLLIAHGLYGSARNWGVIAKRLAESRQVFAVDMRNHGLSDWFQSHNYDDLANDLAEVVRNVGTPMDVLGHSMGGKAAMVLALNFPSLVNGLIVADIAPVTYAHSQIEYAQAMRAVDLAEITRRSDAEAQLGELGVEKALQSFFTQSLDVPGKRWRLNLDALADHMPHIMSFPDVSTAFDGSTLFLSGANSDYVLPEHRTRIKDLFPQAKFAKIPGAGHWLHAEKPREFENAIRFWLDRQTNDD